MIRTIQLDVILILCTVFLASACNSSLKVEKGLGNLLAGKIEKVITISPDFEVITSTALEKPRDYKFYQTVEENFLKAIKDNSERMDLEVEIINESKQLNVEGAFYNTLAPLKQEILHAVYMQEFEGGLKNIKVNGVFEFNRKPIISSAYSYLAKEYNTNYFAVQGINLHKKPRAGNYLLVLLFPPLGIYNLAHIETDLYYYNIVADVSKGEIVHKELRKVVQPINKSTMNAMIYDSYKIMTR